MDIQKDRFMRHLTLFILCFIFIACERASLKRAENLLNFSLNNSVCFLQKHEYWNDFNGNGFRVEVYNILDILKSATIIQYTIKGRFMSR